MTEANINITAPPSVSQALADFAANTRYDALPAEVVDYALLCIADSIGIAFACWNRKRNKGRRNIL